MKLAALTASALVLAASTAGATDLNASQGEVTREVPADVIYSEKEQTAIPTNDVTITDGMTHEVPAEQIYSNVQLEKQNLEEGEEVTVTEVPQAPLSPFNGR